MDDQHRFDWFGFAGHPVVKTPHLDRLAREGVVFTNAYTPAPLCVPARQCLARGQFPRHCGVEHFGEDLPPASPTVARALARIGYTTACAGKLHHSGTDPMQGWMRRVCAGDDLQVSPGFLEDRDPCAYRRWHEAPPAWSLAEELNRAGVGRSPYAVSDALNVAAAEALVEEYFVSSHYRKATPGRPLLLKVSLQLPHYPFCAVEERYRRYEGRLQPYPERECLDHPAFRNWTRTPPEVEPGAEGRALAATAALVEECDEHFGRILHALEAAGQSLDDWLVLYTSDHGDLLGEHDKWWKMSFYEGSVKVPLVMRGPKWFPGGGREVTQNVSLCDLYATLADLAQAPTPGDLDSRSLLPLLQGRVEDWPDEAVSQYGGAYCMVKKGNLKYQWYGDGWPEVLFDLGEDPAELRNVVGDPRYTAAVASLRRRRDELGFGAGGK